MALDIMKRDIAGPGDAADFKASLERYSLTDHAPVVVANTAEANQIATALVNAGATQAFPLFVYISDFKRHLCKPSPTEGWEILGGRLHGAQARIDRTANPGQVEYLRVNQIDGFLRQSVGFTRGPDGGVLIPETGLYRIHFGGRVVNTYPTETGYRYVRLLLNGDYLGGRVEFEGDAHFTLAFEWLLSQGDEVMAVGYQNIQDAQGQTSRRVIAGTLGLYQSLNPSW